MAITKENLFNDSQKQTARLMKALGHPARIAIVELLAERQRCVCGDITDELPLAQSTVSQHLKALKKAGIIKGEVDGPRVCYCLDEQTVGELNQRASQLVHRLSSAVDGAEC